jgi:hypothetical protein
MEVCSSQGSDKERKGQFLLPSFTEQHPLFLSEPHLSSPARKARGSSDVAPG